MRPRKVLHEREVIRRLAAVWLCLGLLGLALTAIAALAHYGFGAPIRDLRAHRAAAPADAARVLAAFLGGSGLFAAVGAAVLRWQRKA